MEEISWLLVTLRKAQREVRNTLAFLSSTPVAKHS